MKTLEQLLKEHRKANRFLKFKLWFDVWAQSVILAVFFFFFGFGDGFTAFCLFYFLLGGYQLLSALVHLTTEKAWEHRRLYYIQLIIHAGVGFLSGAGSCSMYKLFYCFCILSCC
ncbi:MAG TPA: hypothetical protein VD905_20545 [Flavobacteriales bacterium]|nr:hypothetical protein [Flavobacteriales bacterium]